MASSLRKNGKRTLDVSTRDREPTVSCRYTITREDRGKRRSFQVLCIGRWKLEAERGRLGLAYIAWWHLYLVGMDLGD